MANVHTHIIKVQVPLATNRTDAVALVYDKALKHLVEQPISPAVRDALKGDTKAFFAGTWNDGFWNISKRLPEQFW